jgi:hypothetical protein
MTLSIIESRKWLTLPFRLGLNGGDNVRIRIDRNYSDYLFDRVDRTQSSVRGNPQDHHVALSVRIASMAIAAIFLLAGMLAGYRYIGWPPVIIVGGSGVAAFVLWSRTYLRRPLPPEVVLPAFLLTVAGLQVHLIEEYLTGFAPAMSRLFNISAGPSSLTL